MKINRMANPTPASDVAARSFLCVTFFQASGVRIGQGPLSPPSPPRGEGGPDASLGDGDLDVHLQVVEAARQGAVVQADAHLDHAGVGLRGRVDVEHVALEDQLADPLDLALELLAREGPAGDGGL